MLKTIILCEGNKQLVQKSFVWKCMDFTCCHLIKEWLNVLHAWSKIVKASKLQIDFLLYVFFYSIDNTFSLVEAGSRELKSCCLRHPTYSMIFAPQFHTFAWLLLIDHVTFVLVFSHIFLSVLVLPGTPHCALCI